MCDDENETDARENIVFREPNVDDGALIYTIIKNSPPLDLNSLYYYLIFCSHFKKTSIVAEKKGDIAGFISGYLKPGEEKVLFVWQVVVHGSYRSQGIAGRMLSALVERPGLEGVEYVETTVTPSNTSSQAFFESFARAYEAGIEKKVLFPAALFGDGSHEEEVLFTIGPLYTK